MNTYQFSGPQWDSAMMTAAAILKYVSPKNKSPKLQQRALAAIMLYGTPFLLPVNTQDLESEVQVLITRGLVLLVESDEEKYGLTRRAQKYLEEVQ